MSAAVAARSEPAAEERQTEGQSQPQPELYSQSQPQSQPQPQPQPQSQSQSQSQSQPQLQPQPPPQSQPLSQSQSQPHSQPQPQSQSRLQPLSQAQLLSELRHQEQHQRQYQSQQHQPQRQPQQPQPQHQPQHQAQQREQFQQLQQPLEPQQHGLAGPPELVRESMEDAFEGESGDEAEEAGARLPTELITGNAGARLIGVLEALTAHLGEHSRFMRAAQVLQHDLAGIRAQAAHSIQHALQQGPPETVALGHPEVAHSVTTVLRSLHESPQLSRDDWYGQSPVVESTPPSQRAVQQLLRSSAISSVAAAQQGAADTCAICLDHLADGALLLQMPCSLSHCFHEACLLRWFQDKNSCPLCRKQLECCDP